MRNKSVILGFFLLVTAAMLPVSSFAAKTVTEEEIAAPPDATVDFEATQMRLIVGGAVGSGVLHFKGQDYPFSMKAATIGGVGVTELAGMGAVFHLTKVEDFGGKYAGVGIGGALIKGKGTSAFKNSKGVVVQTKAKATGVAMNLGAGGISVTMGVPK